MADEILVRDAGGRGDHLPKRQVPNVAVAGLDPGCVVHTPGPRQHPLEEGRRIRARRTRPVHPSNGNRVAQPRTVVQEMTDAGIAHAGRPDVAEVAADWGLEVERAALGEDHRRRRGRDLRDREPIQCPVKRHRHLRDSVGRPRRPRSHDLVTADDRDGDTRHARWNELRAPRRHPQSFVCQAPCLLEANSTAIAAWDPTVASARAVGHDDRYVTTALVSLTIV